MARGAIPPDIAGPGEIEKHTIAQAESSIAWTLLHGSSRRMSNHGVFQHWG